MDEVGGEGEEESDHEENVVLVFAKLVEVGEAVVHEEVGNRDLGVEDNGEGRCFDVGRECRDEAGSHGGS